MAMFARVPLSPATLDAMAAVAHGIALGIDRKRAEEALIASKTEIAQILESITDGFASLDLDLCYKYVNREGARMLGRPAEELIGRSIYEVFPDVAGSSFARPSSFAWPSNRRRRSKSTSAAARVVQPSRVSI